MTAPKKGDTFTHKSFLAQEKTAPRGQKALMKVTAVRRGAVYYTYASEADDTGAFYLPLDIWEERYGQS